MRESENLLPQLSVMEPKSDSFFPFVDRGVSIEKEIETIMFF